MNVSAIKFIDRYCGVPLVLFLSIFKRPQRLNSGKRILLIQLWGIGETICTIPTLDAVRKKFPKSQITVLATPRNKVVYEGCPCLDEVLDVKLTPTAIISFVWTRYNEFDIALDMEEYLNISALIGFFVGKYRVGYANQTRSMLYDKSVPYNDKQHVVHTFFDLATQIGVRAKIEKLLGLPVDRATKKQAQQLLAARKVSKKDFVVGLGTGSAESSQCRKWQKERFAELADILIKRYDAKVVFVGSADEAAHVDNTISMMESKANKAISLAGKTGMSLLFAVSERFDLFIGNDSGPMHVAAAQGVKTIGLFGPNLPARFGPFGRQNRAIYRGDVCEFSPCINVHLGQVPDCLYPRHSDDYQKCMKAIRVEDVLKTVEGILHEEGR